MFRKIILGYKYSSSLGDRLLEYENELRKKNRWRMISIALILFALFSIIFAKQFASNYDAKFTPIRKIESTKNLDLSSKIVFSPDVAKENSQILIELRAKNTTNKPQIFNFEFQSSDILEYAEIKPQESLHISKDFSNFDEIKIPPHTEELKQISIVVKNKIPAFKQKSNSFDCKVSLFFGNLTSQNIKCPTIKSFAIFEKMTGFINIKYTIWILSILLFISIISVFRTNLLLKQISILKRNQP